MRVEETIKKRNICHILSQGVGHDISESLSVLMYQHNSKYERFNGQETSQFKNDFPNKDGNESSTHIVTASNEGYENTGTSGD